MPTTKGQEKLRFPQTSGWVYEVLQTAGQLRNANTQNYFISTRKSVLFPVNCSS